MNPVRIKYVRDMLQQFGGPELARAEATTAAPFAGLRILDIGCGGGFVSEPLCRLGATVVGADASNENIQVATTHYRRDPALARGPGSIDYRHTTAESLVEQEEQFDVVVALEIIEHVNDPKQFVRTCSQLVKPEGMLIFSTINRTPASYLFTILLAEHLLRWVPVGTHTHDKYIMPEELELYLKMAGCQPLDVSGMGYNPLLKSWTLVSKSQPGNLEMNYILAARKSIL
nr:hypothetical protein HK105_005417 [Polyrhizophydium stewartii]